MSLKPERLAAGIDDPDLDAAVAGALISGKACHIPGAARVLRRIEDDMRLMAAPVLAAPPPSSGKSGFGDRLDKLLAARPGANGDLVDPEAISAMTKAGEGPDSLHGVCESAPKWGSDPIPLLFCGDLPWCPRQEHPWRLDLALRL